MFISLFFITFFAFISLVVLVKLLPEPFSKYVMIAIIGAWFTGVCLIAVVPFFGSIPGYSDGARVCYLEKFSKKGVFFKTYEGLGILKGMNDGTKDNPGMKRVEWEFSVVDEKIAAQLDSLQGEVVKLHYQQNYVSAFRHGSSTYIIDGVEKK